MAKREEESLQGVRYKFDGPEDFPPPANGYDPRRLGCKCDVCPLGHHLRSVGQWFPVPPVRVAEAKGAIFGESPGKKEVEKMSPFVGRSGWKLNEGLEANELDRKDFSIGNAIACRPPGDKMERFMAQLTKENARRRKEERPTLPSPGECCKPQFIATARGHSNLLLLGGSAYEALTKKTLVPWGKLFGDETSGPDELVMEKKRSVKAEKKRSVQRIRGSMIDLWWYERQSESGLRVLNLVRNEEGTDRAIPQDAVPIRVVPTWHPAFILREPQWQPTFYSDIGRWWRWINNKLNWKPPVKLFVPTPSQLEAFLYDPNVPFHAVDIETDGKESLTCRLRCIGIGTGTHVMVVPFLGVFYDTSIDGRGCGKDGNENGRAWYINGDAAKIREILIRWLLDPRRLKVGHNLYFDWGVLVRELLGGRSPVGYLDNILLCRANNSDLPKDLYTTGTMYSDVPDWKEADGDRKISVNPRSDHELWGYNGVDVAVTAQCFPPLWAGANRRGQIPAVKIDHVRQYVYRGLHQIGMHVDQPTRQRGEDWLREKAIRLKRQIRDLLGDQKFNPNSADQWRKLLYQDWKYPMLRETDTGEPTADDDAIRDFIIKKVCQGKPIKTVVPNGWTAWNNKKGMLPPEWKWTREAPEQAVILETARSYRATVKLLGTYFLPARPSTMRWYEYDDKGKKKGKERHGWCMPDGRMHAGFNAHCYDGETEILTDRGWVRFDALADGTPVAQWDADTREISFVVPSGYVRSPYEGDIVEFENKDTDLVVTPNHRMPLLSNKTKRVKEFLAGSLPRPGGQNTGWHTLHAGTYAGGPGVEISDALLRVLVMTQADGSLVQDRGLALKFTKPRKVERCRELLEAAGLPFTYNPAAGTRFEKPVHVFYIAKDAVPQVLRTLLGEEKTFGPWVLDLTRVQIDIVLDEMWHWDALHKTRTQYTTTKKTNADWLQALLVLSGIRTNQYPSFEEEERNTVHVLGVKRHVHNCITDRARYETKPYKGMVYCVTVPTSWVVVRRNGKVTISGNSVATGRGSSSKPWNAQNTPLIARHFLTAEDGNLLIGCDFDQIELRMVSVVAGCKQYMEEFARDNSDPHTLTATLIYGDKFTKLVKKSAGWKRLRTIAKSFTYAVIYGAEITTIYETISAAEDPNTGDLLFPDLTLDEIRAVYNTWMKGVPEVKVWWEKCWNFAKTHGYITEPILGRRRDFPTFERNEIPNMQIQGGAGVIMAMALEQLVEAIPFNFAGPNTGLVLECHDATVFEVPEKRAKEMAEIIKSKMQVTVPSLPGMVFSSKPDIGYRLSEV